MQRFATSQWPGALTEPITEFHSGVGTWDDKPRLPLPLRLTLRVIGREVRAALSRWATGRWFSGLWRGDRAELQEQSEVVSGRPVFRDQVIGDPKDVDVLHGVRLSRGRRRDQCRALNTDPTVWQRIRRTVRSDPKRAADSYSADDEVVFRDEVINLPAAVGKGSPKGLEDPPDSIPATRLLRSVSSRRVINSIGSPHLCRLVRRSPVQGIVIAPDQILVRLLFGSASLRLGSPNHQYASSSHVPDAKDGQAIVERGSRSPLPPIRTDN